MNPSSVKSGVDLSSANVEAPDDNVIADFIQGKTPEKETASDESSEEGEEEAKAEVTKEFQELVGDEDTVAVEEKEDAPEAESNRYFATNKPKGASLASQSQVFRAATRRIFAIQSRRKHVLPACRFAGIPCCFQRQPDAQNRARKRLRLWRNRSSLLPSKRATRTRSARRASRSQELDVAKTVGVKSTVTLSISWTSLRQRRRGS